MATNNHDQGTVVFKPPRWRKIPRGTWFKTRKRSFVSCPDCGWIGPLPNKVDVRFNIQCGCGFRVLSVDIIRCALCGQPHGDSIHDTRGPALAVGAHESMHWIKLSTVWWRKGPLFFLLVAVAVLGLLLVLL